MTASTLLTARCASLVQSGEVVLLRESRSASTILVLLGPPWREAASVGKKAGSRRYPAFCTRQRGRFPCYRMLAAQTAQRLNPGSTGGRNVGHGSTMSTSTGHSRTDAVSFSK